MKTIREVTGDIEKLSSFAEFSPELWAPDDGAAHAVAADGKDRIKMTQIRKLLSSIKRIEGEHRNKRDDEPLKYEEISLLLPQLAYALGRNLITREFYDMMKTCLSRNKVRTVGDFRRFVDFLEAIVAYWKMETKGAKG